MNSTACSFRRLLKIILFLVPVFLITISINLAGCTRHQPEPKIINLTEQEAAEQAQKIREKIAPELADGFDLSLWASEKLLEDPIGLDVDNQGRIFITVTNRRRSSEIDIRRHRDWMIESISWNEVEDRKNFLHRELSPGRSEVNSWLPDQNDDGSHDWRDLTVEREEIYRIEDTSGDGIADQSQLYIKDFHTEETDVAGAVLSHNDEVFVGVAPDMWRLKDTSGDGMADSKESISYGYAVHIGFGGHGMSGLIMGPDGRIYWGIGDIGLNVEGPDGKKWYYPNQGAVLRSDPDGSNFEVFAAGVRNTHEFTFDKYGNLIAADNDGDHAGEFERLVYLVNGSDSGWRTNWQFGKYVDPKNNDYKVWMDENYFKPRFEDQAAHLLPPIAPYHSGPAGMAYNPGTALSDRWEDHFFVAEFTGSPARSVIHAFTLKPKGASFELETDQPVVKGVLATGLDFGPDGALYFADWIEGWSTKDKGRIWKLDTPAAEHSKTREETKQILAEQFSNRSEEELLQLMKHEDMRVRMNAQFELAGREAVETLLAAVEQTDHQLTRLHGIWGIGQLARQDVDRTELLVSYLQDPDPEIRAQAAKVIGDVRYQPAADVLIPLLRDKSARVRFFAAEALGRIAYHPAIQPIVDMLEANNDEDVYLRHGGAIALARIGDAEPLAALADHPSEAVRIAAVVALRRLEDPAVARFLQDESEFVVTNAARAINDDIFIKEALPELARMLDQQRFANEPLLRRAINANLFNGAAADAQRLASFAVREGVPENMQIEALATLGVWPDPSTLDRVTGHYRGEIKNDPEAAREAVASIMTPVLTEGASAVKVAAAEAAGRLNYKPAASSLFALVKKDPSAEVRIAALEALQAIEYEQMEEAVKVALDDRQQTVRMTALGIIPSLDLPEKSTVDLLASVLGKGSVVEQQSALEALGKLQNEAAYEVLNAQIGKLMAGELPPEIHLDVIEAVENTGSGRLLARLKQYQSSKPEGDAIAAYRESLQGGDADRGRQIFYQHEAAQCTRCHAIKGRGGDVGPELGNIGSRLSREQLLESLVEPGLRIAPGYGSVAVTLKDGNTVRGILKEETDSFVVLQSSDGETSKIPKTQIAERRNSPSAMPPMGNILSRSELRDMVEFLNTLK